MCTEMWPGNTADAGSLIPVVDRLRQRFCIRRVCVVADRGLISAVITGTCDYGDIDYGDMIRIA